MSTAQAQTHAPLEAIFTPADLPDAAELLKLRSQIYAADLDPVTRREYLGELADNTITTGGASLAEAAVEQVTSSDPEGGINSRKRLQLAQKTSKIVIGVMVDPDSGAVTEVVEHKEVNTPASHIRGQRAMADRIPYGPKMNDTSFRRST